MRWASKTWTKASLSPIALYIVLFATYTHRLLNPRLITWHSPGPPGLAGTVPHKGRY